MTKTRKPVSAIITDAFIELMREKSFTDITVTDVIKRAGVARASFYRNFGSTSDILDSVMESIVRNFRETALPVICSQDERKWRAFLFRYIYFISDNQDKLIPRQTVNASTILYRLANAAQDLSQTLVLKSVRDKYSISSRVSVINSVISLWIYEGKKETPEEIVDYLMSFILTI